LIGSALTQSVYLSELASRTYPAFNS